MPFRPTTPNRVSFLVAAAYVPVLYALPLNTLSSNGKRATPNADVITYPSTFEDDASISGTDINIEVGTVSIVMIDDKNDDPEFTSTTLSQLPDPTQLLVSRLDVQSRSVPSADITNVPCTNHGRFPMYIFPIAGLTLLSCTFLTLAGFVIFILVSRWRVRRKHSLPIKSKSPLKSSFNRSNLSIFVPSRDSSYKSTSLKVIPERESDESAVDPFPPTPTQFSFSHTRPLSPTPPALSLSHSGGLSPLLPVRLPLSLPDSPARSTFSSHGHSAQSENTLKHKQSFLSLAD